MLRLTFLPLMLLLALGLNVGCDQFGTSENKDKNGSSVVEQVGDMARQATDTGVDGAEWVRDQVSDATDSGMEMASDAGQWVTDTFESLKNQGLTTANSATEWLSEDFNNIGGWRYKVLTVPTSELAKMESELDQLGQQRWECFHVVSGDDGSQIFYFKKPRKSYLKHLPLKDLVRIVPLMNGSDGESE